MHALTLLSISIYRCCQFALVRWCLCWLVCSIYHIHVGILVDVVVMIVRMQGPSALSFMHMYIHVKRGRRIGYTLARRRRHIPCVAYSVTDCV